MKRFGEFSIIRRDAGPGASARAAGNDHKNVSVFVDSAGIIRLHRPLSGVPHRAAKAARGPLHRYALFAFVTGVSIAASQPAPAPGAFCW
jgi:hypothetical protein